MGKPSPEERKTLGAFLAGKRASIQPSSPISRGKARRTPGLRREEVASLAGVSASWYTWIEQGRDIQISVDTIRRIATVLQLEQVEFEYLLALAQHFPVYTHPSDEVSEAIITMIQAMDPIPAYVRNTRFDILAWNRSITELFVDYGALQPYERNTIRLMFLHRPYRTLILNWKALAREYVSSLRAARTKASDKEPFDRLIAELYEASEDFRRWWSDAHVSAFNEGRKLLHHSSLGEVEYSYVAMTPESHSNLSVVVYVLLAASGDLSS